MTEKRPCILNKRRHPRKCSPDLTGMKIGYVTILSRSEQTKKGSICWRVLDKYGYEHPKVLTSHILLGIFRGLCCPKNSGLGSCDGHGKARPEYVTVVIHHHMIFNPKYEAHNNYRKMPFYDKWNPDKNGSFIEGMHWIIENLGPRPKNTLNSKWSLDIIDHIKGFVPGNLRWALKNTQRKNQRYKKLGEYSVKELKTELRRHGYGIHKL